MTLSSIFKRVGFAFFLFASLTAAATIQRAKTMDEVIQLFQPIKSTDLAIFDVDGVLTLPSDPTFQFSNAEAYKFSIWKLMVPLTTLQRECLGPLIVTSSPSILVDKKVLDLFEMLHQKRVKAIALSALLTGSIHEIPDLAKWRYEELKRLGIDFSLFFPCYSEIIFDQFPVYRGNYPTLYKGIMLTNGSSVKKGDLLVAFLSRINQRVENVYFIEDTLENLTSTEEILKEKMPSVHLVGIHYTEAHDNHEPTVDLATYEKRLGELIEEAKRCEKNLPNKKAA